MTTMTATTPRKLIADLGSLIGIPSLASAADGSCQLMFDGRHVVTLVFVPALHKFVISCPCEGDPTSDARVALLALEANFMGCASGGGCLSVGPDKRLHLQFHLGLAHLEAGDIMASIENLLNRVEAWSRRLHVPDSVRETARTLAVAAQR